MYRDQSATELRLNLLGGELDVGQFRVLQAGRVVLAGVSVDAGIIGASHLVRLSAPGMRLYEVLACGDVRSDSPPVFAGAVDELPETLDLRLGAGLGYCFRPRVLGTAEAAGRLRCLAARIAAAAPCEVGLHQRFPGPTADPPQTLLWVGLDDSGDGVRIETAHSYPNEGTVVFSETRLVGNGTRLPATKRS